MPDKEQTLPSLGKDFYLGTELYMSHGIDDFDGGLCRIINIINEEIKHPKNERPPINMLYVEFEERPGFKYNWNYIIKNQEEWRKAYGKRRGRPIPDYRREFNDPFGF